MEAGFVPFGRADGGVDDAWFRLENLPRLRTLRAEVFGGRQDLQGLFLQDRFEKLMGNVLTEFDDEFLDIGETGAPGKSVRAVEFVVEIFGHAVKIVPVLGNFGPGGF